MSEANIDETPATRELRQSSWVRHLSHNFIRLQQYASACPYWSLHTAMKLPARLCVCHGNITTPKLQLLTCALRGIDADASTKSTAPQVEVQQLPIDPIRGRDAQTASLECGSSISTFLFAVTDQETVPTPQSHEHCTAISAREGGFAFVHAGKDGLYLGANMPQISS